MYIYMYTVYIYMDGDRFAYTVSFMVMISFRILILLVTFVVYNEGLKEATRRPPALFIFGDSIADVGSNSYIHNCQARANFPYYGIDFANSVPTGRFSNGFNTVDYISKLLGFERSPDSFFSYSRSGKSELFNGLVCPLTWMDLILSSLGYNPRRKMVECVLHGSNLQRDMFTGVSFASGGSGLLDTSGKTLNIVPMSEQINQFVITQSSLAAAIGESSTHYMLSESIFFISSGNNDVLEYFETNSSKPKEQSIGDLILAYETFIKVLYSLGARKFGILSVVPQGCNPAQRLFNTTGGCFDAMNDFCSSFHYAIEALLHKISLELNGFSYSLGNMYDVIMNIIQNPTLYNLKYVDSACCGSGRFNAEITCNSSTSLCKKRSEYLYWDRNHPTEAAAHLVATMLHGGQLQFVSPVNFHQLASTSNY